MGCVRIRPAVGGGTPRSRSGPAPNVDGNRVRVREGEEGDPIRIASGSGGLTLRLPAVRYVRWICLNCEGVTPFHRRNAAEN